MALIHRQATHSDAPFVHAAVYLLRMEPPSRDVERPGHGGNQEIADFGDPVAPTSQIFADDCRRGSHGSHTQT